MTLPINVKEFNKTMLEKCPKWTETEIRQLFYLKMFLASQNRDAEFDTYVELFKVCEFYWDKMEQTIKCIVHDIPVMWAFLREVSEPQMNELRRFLEDTNDGDETNCTQNEFVNIVKDMIVWEISAESIYEFRRLWKNPIKMNPKQARALMEFLMKHKMWNWMIISALGCVYERNLDKNNPTKCFDKMMEFAEECNTKIQQMGLNNETIETIYQIAFIG